jgi:hypothetical protein
MSLFQRTALNLVAHATELVHIKRFFDEALEESPSSNLPLPPSPAGQRPSKWFRPALASVLIPSIVTSDHGQIYFGHRHDIGCIFTEIPYHAPLASVKGEALYHTDAKSWRKQ